MAFRPSPLLVVRGGFWEVGFCPGKTSLSSSSVQPWREMRCSSSVTGLRVAWKRASASLTESASREGVGERAGVLDGRVRALALVVQHRVGRIAHEDHGVRVPRVDRVDVVDRADVDCVHVEVAGDVHDPLVEALHSLQECRPW